jgi:hypothetical protein
MACYGNVKEYEAAASFSLLLLHIHIGFMEGLNSQCHTCALKTSTAAAVFMLFCVDFFFQIKFS